MPLLVFLTLGLVQLTAVEQAKLMTEYAAYQAARAGIVWSGNNERMRNAALVALLPTLDHRTDSVPEMASALAHARRLDAAFQVLPWGTTVPPDVNGSSLQGLVRVDTLNPADYASLDTIWKLAGERPWQELDFDGAASFPPNRDLARHIARFFDLKVPDADEDLYRRATVLSVRLRYWYEMRVPFANWVVFLSWYAANAGAVLHGAIDRPTLQGGVNLANRRTDVSGLVSGAPGISNETGYATAYPEEMAVLWALSQGSTSVSGQAGPHFYLPLSATYGMRMQSNFDRKWLVHPSPSWAP